MNPLTNALKLIGTTGYQLILAFVFFSIGARVTDPAFFGEVAVIQLLEALVGSVFFFIPQNVITRDVAASLAKEDAKKLVETYLALPIVTLPLYPFFLTMPKYVWLAIPYLYLFFVQAIIQNIMYGANLFTEASILHLISVTFRWGISLVAILNHSYDMFITVWTSGALVSVLYGLFVLKRKVKSRKGRLDVRFYIKKFNENKFYYGQSVVAFLSSQGDRLMTVYFLGQSELGLYQFGALIAMVPLLLFSSVYNSYLAAASYFRSRGIKELEISVPAFRVVTVTFSILITLGILLSEVLIPLLFPNFSQGLNALKLLLVASMLYVFSGIPMASILAFQKDQRPFLVLAVTNSLAVVGLSALLIPYYSVIGGALAQLLVSAYSTAFVLYYSKSVEAIRYGSKEIGALMVAVGVAFVEVFLTNVFFSALAFIGGVLALRLLRVITEHEIQLLNRLVPNRLKLALTLIRAVY